MAVGAMLAGGQGRLLNIKFCAINDCTKAFKFDFSVYMWPFYSFHFSDCGEAK